MEGVDHIHIVQVCRSRLIRHIDGVLERQIPNGKGLKFCVSRTNAAFAIVIKLAHTNSHFATSRAGCSNDYERARGLDIIVFAVSLIAYDMIDIGGIALDFVVAVNTHTQRLQTALEFKSRRLIAPTCKHNATYQKSKSAKSINETQNIKVIGDAKVTAHLVLFNIRCADNNDDFGFILELGEHMHLTVGGKAGEHTCRMKIVKQFAAKLKVEFAAKLVDATANMR